MIYLKEAAIALGFTAQHESEAKIAIYLNLP
jgi:hypothetical protein